jgi:hypothetical protein
VGNVPIATQVGFVVSDEADTTYTLQLLQTQGWAVMSGTSVSRHAYREITQGSRRILIGHGTHTSFHLAREKDQPSRWLWVGMKRPPGRSSIYLYSCYCGSRLTGSLRRGLVVGHYGKVPIPTAETEPTIVPYLRAALELLDVIPSIRRSSFRAELRKVAGDLVRVHYGTAELHAWLAAVAIGRSLFRVRAKKRTS